MKYMNDFLTCERVKNRWCHLSTPSELSRTKELFKLIVTPGIRLKNDD
jgi:hypothetical protein